jgi:hypothetical protein
MTLTCVDFEQTKAWIQQNALVQFVVVGDDRLRAWAEYFLLAALPAFLRFDPVWA